MREPPLLVVVIVVVAVDVVEVALDMLTACEKPYALSRLSDLGYVTIGFELGNWRCGVTGSMHCLPSRPLSISPLVALS